jgi:hypothetical protein
VHPLEARLDDLGVCVGGKPDRLAFALSAADPARRQPPLVSLSLVAAKVIGSGGSDDAGFVGQDDGLHTVLQVKLGQDFARDVS